MHLYLRILQENAKKKIILTLCSVMYEMNFVFD